ncbi:MAG: hypothetical protein L6V91_03345 [Bacilli bacterium]|nr:MAG: hypothetical protein L6V91_03345 [Bacilli bacterium]
MPNMLYEIPDSISKLDTKKNIITVSRLDYGKKKMMISLIVLLKIDDKKNQNYILLVMEKEYDNLKLLINNLQLNDRVILTGYKKI